MTHIDVGKLTIIGSDNGLSPGRRQAIIWTNAGILLIGPLGTNFNEIVIAIQTFSVKKMHLKMASAKWRPFCLGLNVLSVKGFGAPYIRDLTVYQYVSNDPHAAPGEIWTVLVSGPCVSDSVMIPQQDWFRVAPSQWVTSLQSNTISHWLDTNLESALHKPFSE